MDRNIRIGLIGNPNSGKTTMYNALTGSNQYVGNWAGVTVEKKEAKVRRHNNVILTDLPGIYSLSAFSIEEIVTRDFLFSNDVDVIINIVDATNIERNLYLTTQLLEIGKPVVIALNLIDVANKRDDKINVEKLSTLLNVPIIVTSALKNKGLTELIDKAVSLVGTPTNSQHLKYSLRTAKAIEDIKELINVDSQFDGVHLLDKDKLLIEKYKLENNENYKHIVSKYEIDLDTDSETALVEERYNIIENIVKASVNKKTGVLTTTEKIDHIITNRFLALPIFVLIMFVIYYISITTIGDMTIGFMEYLIGDLIGENVRTLLINFGTQEWLVNLIVDGIIGGVGSVLVFIPQLIILFLFLSILEDSGYMARVAFIMDRLFKKFGLSGKSFIPMLIGTGCSVPAIMASRTIENEKERRMTIMLTPFIPCGAKLPVFALFIGAFFGPLASISMYLIGIAVAIICGILLKKLKYFKGDATPFILELPDYRLPSFKNTAKNVWDKARGFLVKAGTIIFISCTILWLLQSFSWEFKLVEAEYSMMADIGRVFAFLFKPLGFGNWQSTVAIMTGMIAKEQVVATFGILFNVEESLLVEQVRLLFTSASAFAFMTFTLLAAPCLAAIGAIKKEMVSKKATLLTILFQTGVAYIVSLLVYQGVRLFTENKSLGITIIIALLIIVCLFVAIKSSLNKKGCPSGCNCGSNKCK